MSKEGHEPLETQVFEVQGTAVTLPGWVNEIRPHQLYAIDQIMARYREGYTTVLLDAPTGAGKTLIGEVVRQLDPVGRFPKGLYVCTTRGLQDQFLTDFPYARVIKGRSNYPTLDRPEEFDRPWPRKLDASHCQKQYMGLAELPACDMCPEVPYADTEGRPGIIHCPHCHPSDSCPYVVAKDAALWSGIAVANTAYAITELNYVGSFKKFPFWIVDEADTLENVLMGFVEFAIGKRALEKAGVEALRAREGVTKPEQWIEWLDSVKQGFHDQVMGLAKKASGYQVCPPDLLDELSKWSGYKDNLARIRDALVENPENWILDGYQAGHMVFKPVRVAEYAVESFWQHSERQLLMSATPISDVQMADDLGIPENTWASVRVDSQFPPERRRVVVQGRADMTNKKKDTEWPKMIDGVAEVLTTHPDERVLVHTVSYSLSAYLHGELSKRFPERPILTYTQSSQRENVLERYRMAKGAVLIASSLDRGVDLPDDDTRVIVIAKVPFPNLGDKQVQQRFYGTGAKGRSWYATQTVRAMVQMTGRGMRHRDDWCVSYILDAQFGSNVWKNSRHLVPRWWAEALEWRL